MPMLNKITKGDWRYSKENGCITTSPKGLIEGSKIICSLNDKVSFELTGKEADANGIIIALAPKMANVIQSLENDDNSIPDFLWEEINLIKSQLKK